LKSGDSVFIPLLEAKVSGVRCQCSAQPLAKKTVGQIKKNFWSSVPKSAVVGFRIAHSNRQNVGWVECNETQQSPE
jgi:hypothetical protein